MLKMLIAHIYAGMPLSPVLGESVFADVVFVVEVEDETVVVVVAAFVEAGCVGSVVGAGAAP